MKEYILFFDSGVGGLNLLKECKKMFPNENYIYFVENEFSPLGNRTKTEITKIVCDDIEKIKKKYHIKLIVLACNTATSACAEKLRELIAIDIVGVEPPILPALKSECKSILVLCTEATLKYNKLLKLFKNNRLFFYKSNAFAKLIDENIDNLNNILPNIKCELKRYANKRIDAIVIGCTHYSFIKSQLEKFFKNEITFFEPYEAVTKKIETFLFKSENQRLKEIIKKMSETNLQKQTENFNNYEMKLLLAKKHALFKCKIKNLLK